MQNSVGQYQNQPVQPQVQQPQQVQIPNYPQPQTVPVIPNSQSGVHIQIFNPSVGAPGAAPVYNVNAPSYGTNPNQTPSYPSNYYTTNWGQGCVVPQYPAANLPNQAINGGVTQTQNVTVTPPVYNNPAVTTQQQNQTTQPQAGGQLNTNESTSTSNSEKSDKKTEKRTIVMLTDDYIKNVENYLNSQDKEVRLMGAKEVVARALEDPSRKDDKALNALVNKMIQDPDMKVRFLGLSLLYSRNITGDDYTVNVLKNMQNTTTGYGQDALMAANILLKMSGQTTEKEFEVTDKDKKKKKTEDINKVMTLL